MGGALRTIRLPSGPLRYDCLSPRFRVEAGGVAEDEDYAACPQHLTELAFFDKVKAPKGRVTAQAYHPGTWQGPSMFEGNSGHCPLSQAAVPCPPKIHPDKCGVDATYVRSVESPWLYRLEREASWVSWETDNTQSDYVDRIWAARGTVFPKVCGNVKFVPMIVVDFLKPLAICCNARSQLDMWPAPIANINRSLRHVLPDALQTSFGGIVHWQLLVPTLTCSSGFSIAWGETPSSRNRGCLEKGRSIPAFCSCSKRAQRRCSQKIFRICGRR